MIEKALLTSEARTGDATTELQTNTDAVGALFYLFVLENSGGVPLAFAVDGKDPASGEFATIFETPNFIKDGEMVWFVLHPEELNGNFQAQGRMALPVTWRARVVHGVNTSVTYSLGYSTLL